MSTTVSKKNTPDMRRHWQNLKGTAPLNAPGVRDHASVTVVDRSMYIDVLRDGDGHDLWPAKGATRSFLSPAQLLSERGDTGIFSPVAVLFWNTNGNERGR